jgi:hypothetical protein
MRGDMGKNNVIQDVALELEVACAVNLILDCAVVPSAGEVLKQESNWIACVCRRLA